MDPKDPTDPADLLRSPTDGLDDAQPAPDPERFTVHTEWTMVRVSKKRWFGR
jgi:hypothetical protein